MHAASPGVDSYLWLRLQLEVGVAKVAYRVWGGNYAFIPDAGMIGTVFIHAVASLQATFATEATLSLTYSNSLEVEETMDESVLRKDPESKQGSGEAGLMQLQIPLGNLQYGQSRDIFLRVKKATRDVDGDDEKEPAEGNAIAATLGFRRIDTLASEPNAARLDCGIELMAGSLWQTYHVSAMRCAWLFRHV